MRGDWVDRGREDRLRSRSRRLAAVSARSALVAAAATMQGDLAAVRLEAVRLETTPRGASVTDRRTPRRTAAGASI